VTRPNRSFAPHRSRETRFPETGPQPDALSIFNRTLEKGEEAVDPDLRLNRRLRAHYFIGFLIHFLTWCRVRIESQRRQQPE
jgi:hypothetical protein